MPIAAEPTPPAAPVMTIRRPSSVPSLRSPSQAVTAPRPNPGGGGAGRRVLPPPPPPGRGPPQICQPFPIKNPPFAVWPGGFPDIIFFLFFFDPLFVFLVCGARPCAAPGGGASPAPTI